MALKRDKYDIKVRIDDAIKHDGILYDFTERRSIVWMDYTYVKY